ncbi:uncharacterized protein LOC132708153 isoform X2 [Cylas formicarius]|uniref:uncharacterized protein LOC132708153 isoform X2 n=1 Tax=Cylas formicarius TaxID=197179 RepID=UPI00295896E8|nr:uncharacterized protein LOC132708153 isoform X2 [Cylas formicarius]
MGSQNTASESDFNVLQFEKTLNTLKDSQESINSCCQWCLKNRQHHKKIVNAWLNVLKRVKVEQRLILFYLANDVVQYSKRRNYEYVESWGTALQKATTMVRDDRVKHKILRIFKIWEQRAVYGEEFIADLCGLINVTPTGVKNDEPHEFQATYVVNKIKTCANLEKDTDAKLVVLREHNPKIQVSENLITSLKDRAHVDDVEKEMEVYVKHMESYINALKAEIKSRIALISVLRQADTQLEADRKDVKLVAHAYKMFGQRVKTFQKKLEEHMATLPSPLPSPDINAPSPSPDSDLELPEDNLPAKTTNSDTQVSVIGVETNIHYVNAGYYNPVTNTITTCSSDTSTSFTTNGFTSFIGTNMSFDVSTIDSSALFSAADNSRDGYGGASAGVATSLPADAPASATPYASSHLPLAPPPMPPFTKAANNFGSESGDLNGPIYGTASNFQSTTTYTADVYVQEGGAGTRDSSQFSYQQTRDAEVPYQPDASAASEEYDPADLPVGWPDEGSWPNAKDTMDTPESPPTFEKEGYADPIEYHDNSGQRGATDVDQRVLPGMGDIDSLSSLGGKDVDHRNLISLTGSPAPTENAPPPRPPDAADDIWKGRDQDYRQLSNPPRSDKDYRLQFNLDLPPPPPPPPKSPNQSSQRPLPSIMDMDIRNPPLPLSALISPARRKESNVESIDMDLSDEDMESRMFRQESNGSRNDLGGGYQEGGTASLGSDDHFSLQPPPPLPDLLDDVDVDANQFLDDLSNDILEFGKLSTELKRTKDTKIEANMWQLPPGMPPSNVPPPGMRPPGLPPPSMTDGHMRLDRQDSIPPGPPMPPMNFFPLGPMPPPPPDQQMEMPKSGLLLTPPLLPNPPTMDMNQPPPSMSGTWMGDQPPPPWTQHSPSHAPPFDDSYTEDGQYFEAADNTGASDVNFNNFREFRGHGQGGGFRANDSWDWSGVGGRPRGVFRAGNRTRGNRGPRRSRGNFRSPYRGGAY